MVRARVPPRIPVFHVLPVDGDSSGEKNAAMKRTPLSLDWWTVVVGFALAALVLLGLPAFPW
jgi:hypothetical protein